MNALETRQQIQALLGVDADGSFGSVTRAAFDLLGRAPKDVPWPPPGHGLEPIDRVGYVDVYRLGNWLQFSAGFTVDADGSPRCYHPDGCPPGLDKLANAGRPGKWWALACDEHGQPYVQGDGDPNPGFYVSTTALEDETYEARDPRRYVDSETVPFIVLPPQLVAMTRLGAKCVVKNERTGKMSWAIVADVGPEDHLGEGSICLAKSLGINASPLSGGVNGGIEYRVQIVDKVDTSFRPHQGGNIG